VATHSSGSCLLVSSYRVTAYGSVLRTARSTTSDVPCRNHGLDVIKSVVDPASEAGQQHGAPSTYAHLSVRLSPTKCWNNRCGAWSDVAIEPVTCLGTLYHAGHCTRHSSNISWANERDNSRMSQPHTGKQCTQFPSVVEFTAATTCAVTPADKGRLTCCTSL